MKKIRDFYLHILKNKTSKKQLLITLLLPLSIIFCGTLFLLNGVLVAALGTKAQVITELPQVQEGLAQQLLRLHVIANSDSASDQEVKRIVKDGLVSYMQTFLEDVESKEESINVLSEHIKELEEKATTILREHGFTYGVNVSLGPATFPIKVYGDITLPAGEYDALRVQLGLAQGKNWWCIIFPNLCYVDATYQVVPEDSKKQLKALLTEEEYEAIVTPEKSKVVVKFKLWEWIKDIF